MCSHVLSIYFSASFSRICIYRAKSLIHRQRDLLALADKQKVRYNISIRRSFLYFYVYFSICQYFAKSTKGNSFVPTFRRLSRYYEDIINHLRTGSWNLTLHLLRVRRHCNKLFTLPFLKYIFTLSRSDGISKTLHQCLSISCSTCYVLVHFSFSSVSYYSNGKVYR